MPRRIHIPRLHIGEIALDPAQAHHARDVLRLADGTAVQVFDDAGATAAGVLLHQGPRQSAVRVMAIDAPPAASAALQWTVASAVPKGDRADWMVEKLSELGAAGFIPLAAARSVVLPEGKGKRERWQRIATEAARQSGRVGVMRIEELTPLEVVIKRFAAARETGVGSTEPRDSGTRVPRHGAWFFATEVPGTPIAQAAAIAAGQQWDVLTIFIGPEGGWTAGEIAAFTSAGLTPVRLGETILRIETAAVAAGVAAAMWIATNYCSTARSD